MAFKPSSRTSGDHPAFVYPATMKPGEAGVIGEALVWDLIGTLTQCGAAETPAFILQACVAASESPSVKPPCLPVDELQEWETALGEVDGAPAPVVPGSRLTLFDDALSCSTATAGGVFEVSGVHNAGNAAVGDKITGYFRR